MAAPSTHHRTVPAVTPAWPRCSAGLIKPISPSFSLLGPALNNSVFVPPVVAVPKCSPHSPSMLMGLPWALDRVPAKWPVIGLNALIRPLPKLPTRRSPPKEPKPAGCLGQAPGSVQDTARH